MNVGCRATFFIGRYFCNGHVADLHGQTGGNRILLSVEGHRGHPWCQTYTSGTGHGVSVRLLTARPAMETVLEYVVATNTTQMNDAAFVSELKEWIR